MSRRRTYSISMLGLCATVVKATRLSSQFLPLRYSSQHHEVVNTCYREVELFSARIVAASAGVSRERSQ